MNDEGMKPEELEAIQKTILSGVAGDFQDAANAVHERYQLRVSARQVEEVYRAMREEDRALAAAKAQATHPPRVAAESSESGEELFHAVIRFAQEMGGFDQARAALDAVEKKLKELI